MPSLSSSLFSSLKNLFSAPAVTSTPAHVARKKTWKLLSCLALGATPAALASSLFSSPVLAQSANANVPVRVQVPKVLQLTTFGDIALTFTASELFGASNASGGLLVQGGTTTGSTPLTTTSLAGIASVAVPISQLYTILTNSSAGANITVAVTTGTLTNTVTGSDTMTMTVTSGGTATTPTTGLGAPNAYQGTATLNFNLTNAKSSGLYNGGSITITATNQ
ncbi:MULTISPECIES: hypothetical protein [unclassified Microcoleus]|uniref:hypothetical protein n=1 Tax=unclassified Microcoleus TaxID=2642155 RepID=UPI002FD78FD8